ncbi:30S ribosomal protein S17 [Patescibacteria group bacterium]|nr:30S ribosomal protein S17 [Patescibacteria group bacterium]
MKKLKGEVVAKKLANTCTVLVTSKFKHKKYKKIVKKSKKYMVHTDIDVNLGDYVEICEIKPMSKLKHFKVLSIVTINKKLDI